MLDEQDVLTPAGSTAPRSTGHGLVDGVLDDLAALDSLPVSDHAQVYERVHQGLQAALTGAADSPDAVGADRATGGRR